MQSSIKNKTELLNLASDFDEFVKEHKWIPRYDIESDALSVTLSILSKDARIKYLNDEVAFYMTKDNKIEGIFIEYFKSNFIKHHRDIKNILKDIEKDKRKQKSLVRLTQDKIHKMAPDLEKAIKLSLAERLDLRFS